MSDIAATLIDLGLVSVCSDRCTLSFAMFECGCHMEAQKLLTTAGLELRQRAGSHNSRAPKARLLFKRHTQCLQAH